MDVDLAHYRVYRSLERAAPERLGEVPVTQTTFRDETLTPGIAAPDASFAEPAIDAWASADVGRRVTVAKSSTRNNKVRMKTASKSEFVVAKGV